MNGIIQGFHVVNVKYLNEHAKEPTKAHTMDAGWDVYASEDCILIIRTILSKLKRLLKLRTKIDNKENINEIISNFKPPIFWKEKDIVRKQVQSWSTEEVKEMIIKINGLETLVKKNSVNSMLFVSDFVSNY